jgi:hypothetical protein
MGATHAAGWSEPAGRTSRMVASGYAVANLLISVGGGKTVHGVLQVFVDGSVYRAYWQPDGGHELYVLANAAANSTRLISTPPQGQPAGAGQPGTVLAPLNVVSCPAL